MNLLSSYILHKAVDKMSKESSYSGRSSDSFDSSIVRPSKKDIQNALSEHGDDVALANYIKNLHTSMWDHCDRRRRESSDNKTQRIVLKHCRENGMTREQEKEVEKLAKKHMDELKPWKRMDARGGSIRALSEGIKIIVIPEDFTLQQKQYLCACMKEYGMDTLVFANENGKEATIISFNAIDVFRQATPQLFAHSFPEDKAEISVSEAGKDFCRSYGSSQRYLQAEITARDGLHMNLEALEIALKNLHSNRFSSSYCQLPYGMKLFEADELQVEQTNASAFMSGGDTVLNGDENLSVPDSTDNQQRDDIDI